MAIAVTAEPRACPYCAPAPECFERQEHDPMDTCPKCKDWAANLDEIHTECEESVFQYTQEAV